MSFAAKLIVFAIVLAILVPMAVVVMRRLIRGKPFAKPKMGDMPFPPPSGPSIG